MKQSDLLTNMFIKLLDEIDGLHSGDLLILLSQPFFLDNILYGYFNFFVPQSVDQRG